MNHLTKQFKTDVASAKAASFLTNAITRSQRARGFSLVEFFLAIMVISLVLGTLTIVNANLRNRAAEHQTQQTLQMLHAALMQYQSSFHVLPSGPTTHAIARLLAYEPSNALLQKVKITLSQDNLPIVLDGFGVPVRYQLASEAGDDVDFVSAGADHLFGDAKQGRVAAFDNIYGIDMEKYHP